MVGSQLILNSLAIKAPPFEYILRISKSDRSATPRGDNKSDYMSIEILRMEGQTKLIIKVICKILIICSYNGLIH